MARKWFAGRKIRGLSSDSKPTAPEADSEFFETNTKKTFDWSGSAWVERSSGIEVTTNVTVSGITATLGDWLELGKDIPSVSTSLSTVSNTDSQITLSWTVGNPTDKVSKHKIEYSTDNSSWTTATLTATGSSYPVTGLSAYVDYYFRISPINIMGTGSTTTTGSVTKTQGIVPSNITNFAASVASTTQINLSWDASTGTPTPTYKVEYKLSSAGSWTELAASQVGTTFNKTGLTAYTDYDFRVTALNAQGSSPTVSLTSITTDGVVPVQITGLILTSSNPDVGIVWDADSGIPTVTYTLEHSLSSTFASGITVKASGGTSTSFTDSNITLDIVHYYRVKGINAEGTGAYSTISNITVLTQAISAVGATESTSGGYNYYEWTSSGTVTVEGYTPDILIVNGGSSGSGQNGGAGGQIRQITGQTGLSGTYTITIGGSNTASVFTGESGYSTTAGANGGIGSYTYSGGAGGTGTQIATFPATWYYSGGGGGGAGQQNSNTYGGAGGSGGGGGGGKGRKGNYGYGGGGGRNTGQNGSAYKHGGVGGANTGGGGGGGGRYSGVGTAGAGGSGVFVLRVPV